MSNSFRNHMKLSQGYLKNEQGEFPAIGYTPVSFMHLYLHVLSTKINKTVLIWCRVDVSVFSGWLFCSYRFYLKKDDSIE